ncbi:MAG: TIR domain-containing protein [Acidobacteriota bacterium]
MSSSRFPALERIAEIIRQSLERGETVEISGLGKFRQNLTGLYEFAAESRPRVFLAYAVEDFPVVDRLFQALETEGFAPWMDRKKLLPGQRWKRALRRAVEHSDYFIACFSSLSVSKRGGFQEELREALNCALAMPLEDIFLIPVRLNACEVPEEISREVQYVDLFPRFQDGVDKIIETIRRQESARVRELLPKAS